VRLEADRAEPVLLKLSPSGFGRGGDRGIEEKCGYEAQSDEQSVRVIATGPHSLPVDGEIRGFRLRSMSAQAGDALLDAIE
jgi:hypothetical protein